MSDVRLIDADVLYDTISDVASSACHDVMSVKNVHELIDSAPIIESQVPRWIPVEERLPSDYGDVLVFSHSGDASAVGLAYRLRNRWVCPYDPYIGEYVTHWMPLPSAPEEVSE